jgi:hypothetical protein
MKQQIPPFITQLLEYTRLAPSVHNTQPWHFIVEDSVILLSVDSRRILKAGDPTHRELWISLGCCLETLLQSAKGLGLKADIQSIQTESITDPIATIHIEPGLSQRQDILDLITKRHSYRGPMEKTDIPQSLLVECRRSVMDLNGVSVYFMDNKESVQTVASLTNQGMSLALSSPDFRKELADLINYNWSSSQVGMPGFVLNRGTIGSIWEKLSIKFGFDIKRKAHADQQKILDASGLFFIASKGDVPSFWLDSGRAYLRIALEITRSGLAHSTLAAPVEAASFHEDIEKLLQTSDRIQAMIRVGKARQINSQVTPRLDINELT